MIIDGKKIALTVQQELHEYIKTIASAEPCLAVILVGSDPASEIYVSNKTKACSTIGIKSLKIHLPSDTSEAQLLKCIDKLNQDATVDGILVQLPLPKHIDATQITLKISPEKDVDGFHPLNLGKLFLDNDRSGFTPCTPLGIKVLLEKSQIPVAGKHVVIVGRSLIVGKPLASLLLRKGEVGNATVSVVHGQTKNLSAICREADILVSAVGKPFLIQKDMVKPGAVVIDVGINRIQDASRAKGYRIVGDIDYEKIKDQCSFITPVPGGVGPMTIAMLLNNTLKSFLQNRSINQIVTCPNIY